MVTRDLEMLDAVADIGSLVTHPIAFDTKQQILLRDAVNYAKIARIGQQLLRTLNDDLEARSLGPRFPRQFATKVIICDLASGFSGKRSS